MVIVRREPFGTNSVVGDRGASTQRRILLAALDMFGAHGFHSTNVELITEAAGCSRPSFYQYFESKDDVFWRLADDLTRELDALADEVGNATPDAAGVARIRNWVRELIDLYERYEPIFVVFPTAARERTNIRRSARNAGARIGTKLAASENGKAVASLHFSVVLRSIYYWRLGLGQLPRDRFVRALSLTLHRLRFGHIAGVNTGPARRAAATLPRAWPHFPPPDQPAARQRGRETKEALVAAAVATLRRQGYHDTNVDDIVQAAGVSHGTFYRYFASKDDLFRVLALQSAMEMVDLVASFPDDPMSSDLDAWLSRWFASYRDNGGVLSTWQEINYDEPTLATFSLEIAVGVFERLQRIVHRRGFGDAAADALALLAVIERSPFASQSLRLLTNSEAIEGAALFIRQGVFGTA